MKIRLLILFGVFATALLVMAFTPHTQQPKPWPVPDNYKTMKNPVTFDKSAAAALYSTHCKSCHGKEGLGDGPKAAQLETPCGDFTTAEFHKQSDGSLFYKIVEGRDDMPSFKKKLPDQEDVWQLVHYIRTMEE